MHPAISVICFTLLSGAGYGLLGILCVDSAVGVGFELESTRRNILALVSLALITVGLLCSTFHLANPRNAWRAFFRFKTSWLSREGVFAILVFPFALLWLVFAWSEFDAGCADSACVWQCQRVWYIGAWVYLCGRCHQGNILFLDWPARRINHKFGTGFYQSNGAPA